LAENYRSTSQILESAHHVILNNTYRKDKDLVAVKGEGEKPVYCSVNNEYGEAEFVVKSIELLKQQNSFNNNDFAVFYRTNAQSRVFEDFFRKADLAYRIIGGMKFYDRKEIKDILSYLRFTINPTDTVSLLRIINTPARGIGAKTIEALRNAAYMNRMNEWEAIENELPIGKKYPKGLIAFRKSILKLIELNQSSAKVSDIVHSAIEDTGYLKSLKDNDTIENRARIENIKEFVGSIYDYEQRSEEPNLAEFLQEVTLLTSEENPNNENLDPENCITLMTVHNAKGLEFPVVFLTGMEEGLFPHSNSSETDEDIEEERRLAYVGITRARDFIFLTSAQFRRSFSGGLNYRQASRFISEIPSELLEFKEYSESSYSYGNSYIQTHPVTNPYQSSVDRRSVIDRYKSKTEKQAVSSASMYKQNQKIRHPKFGEGKIIAITGNSDNIKLTINFSTVGLKSFLEKYTPLEII
jgi:DNA helicase-2/ATP-dependent DNA helicase PcrA